MKILILGDGLLGSELHKQTGWDFISRKKDGIDFKKLLTYEKLIKGYDTVVNCIADTNNHGGENENLYQVNYLGVCNLSEICKGRKIKLVHISTDHVYAGNESEASEEGIPIPAKDYYSYYKSMADFYVRKDNPSALIIRTNFKPRPFPYEKAWINQVGNYDYVDVITELIVKLIEKKAEGIYNVGTELKTIHSLALQSKPNVISALKPKHFPGDVSMDLTKMNKILNSFEESDISEVILTMTTIPTRLKDEDPLGIKSNIESLVNQSYEKPYEIHMNIPLKNVYTGEDYIIPEWLEKEEKIKIFRTEDLGPSTKLVPTVERIKNPNAIIIVVDDDLVYHEDMIKEHIRNQIRLKDAIICYDGLTCVDYPFGDVRDHYFTAASMDGRVRIPQHYKTVSYKRKYFEKDFPSFIEENMSWDDDMMIAAYFSYKKRNRICTYLPSDKPFETLEEWSTLGGVETFPVIKHTNHIHQEGCGLFRGNKVPDNNSNLYKFIDRGYDN